VDAATIAFDCVLWGAVIGIAGAMLLEKLRG